MLLVFMGLLNMVGGNVPPIPPTPHGGGKGGHFRDEKKDGEELWRKKLRADDEEIIPILAGWMIAQQNKN